MTSTRVRGSEVNGRERAVPDHEVVIIGAGFGGIGAGVELTKRGVHDFVILEKWGAAGGTWHANKYPGVAVDIPTFIYSFSYDQKTTWSKFFTPGDELEGYANELVDKHELRRKIRFNTRVVRQEFDEAQNIWSLTLDDDSVITARYVIAATGGLEQPKLPEIEGIDSYQGVLMHTALWDKDVQLAGKRVAVIGTGATSLQLVPEIAPEVGHLTVFQRTPIYVGPKPDLKYNAFWRALFGFPGVAKGIRHAINLSTAYIPDAVFKLDSKYVESASMALANRMRGWMRTQVDDPITREKLLPYYGFGCKRPSFSNTYLKTFNRPNVALVTEPIARITEKGLLTADGVEHEVDVLICATGFAIWDHMPAFPTAGRGGKDLKQFFQENRYQAYQGVSIPDYPNFFLVLGPYGYVFGPYHMLIESTTAHAARVIAETKKRGATTAEVKQDVHQAYFDKMHARNENHLWLSPACSTANTYYIDNHGDSPFRPGGFGEMYFHNKYFRLDNYRYGTETVAPVVKAASRRKRNKEVVG
ncbi:4-hydroxyacetophenone monooxygenase [Mycobacteroides salmoniphilum]|uniref:4-hydroxyacetophenone monooxygenase n=1 Tax=Mycobacteroides salmoniphilum TaxID=404941 RepID=A0A4R8S6V3_9MYCO|nr:NAD(P)/FAD-dependent oxidoreductase [Mycobacteroides salmoniphilum]TDZ87431.1 4-hydroxyacetophenone monooxygenase [Mycobacteroides salmoniphilum]